MSSNGTTYSDYSTSELLEKKKKHQFIIKLIDDELRRRKSSSTEVNLTKKKSDSADKKSISATKDDIIQVLKNKNISYKSHMKKSELESIIRKHNLVKYVENFHKRK